MLHNKFSSNGLTDAQVIAARKQYGQNKIAYKKPNRFLNALIQTVKDPMTILLLAASILYFISGKTTDGIFLASAIILIAELLYLVLWLILKYYFFITQLNRFLFENSVVNFSHLFHKLKLRFLFLTFY
ncbi:MAG: hypothetical protein H7178_10210 [Chitinophagaceae bacterium]|nr:hypothetical protein [Chitinophagaceae bacterium]